VFPIEGCNGVEAKRGLPSKNGERGGFCVIRMVLLLEGCIVLDEMRRCEGEVLIPDLSGVGRRWKSQAGKCDGLEGRSH
jgi:hypothetical protein